MKRGVTAILLSLLILSAQAQVSDIKSASANSSRSGGGRSEGGSRSSGMLSYFFIDLMFNGVVEWQRYMLSKKTTNPSLISVEVIGQAAMQPSSYYIFNPRIRGTWGLFSSDFRINYLVEEDINGFKDLTTFDWQALQLNLIGTRHVIGRIGLGTMTENFGDHKTVPESSYAIQWYTNNRKLSGVIEYRSARNWDDNVVARNELSAYVENQIWSHGPAHLFVTVGAMSQNYYQAVSVWGIQAGLVMKLY